MVNRDEDEKDVTMKTLSSIARDCGRNLLPAIEYDESVPLAAQNCKFVADCFADSSAAESYNAVARLFTESGAAQN
jgi:hypothetical protein